MAVAEGSGVLKPLRRLWIFETEDEGGNSTYLDADGRVVSRVDALPFEGTNIEAGKEADRRAGLWEDRGNVYAARIIYHSLGRIQ